MFVGNIFNEAFLPDNLMESQTQFLVQDIYRGQNISIPALYISSGLTSCITRPASGDHRSIRNALRGLGRMRLLAGVVRA